MNEFKQGEYVLIRIDGAWKGSLYHSKGVLSGEHLCWLLDGSESILQCVEIDDNIRKGNQEEEQNDRK